MNNDINSPSSKAVLSRTGQLRSFTSWNISFHSSPGSGHEDPLGQTQWLWFYKQSFTGTRPRPLLTCCLWLLWCCGDRVLVPGAVQYPAVLIWHFTDKVC